MDEANEMMMREFRYVCERKGFRHHGVRSIDDGFAVYLDNLHGEPFAVGHTLATALYNAMTAMGLSQDEIDQLGRERELAG